MTTLLVIDIGNTNVSLGLFDYATTSAGELSQHWRIGTHREQTSDEVALMLIALFEHAGRSAAEVTDVIISSVVPPLLPIWERVSDEALRPPSRSSSARGSAPACRCATRTRARSAPTASSTPWRPTRCSAAP